MKTENYAELIYGKLRIKITNSGNTISCSLIGFLKKLGTGKKFISINLYKNFPHNFGEHIEPSD